MEAVYANQAAIEEAEALVKTLLARHRGSLEGAVLSCIMNTWGEVAERLDEALTRHYWNKATIVVKCSDVRLSLFLAFARKDRESEWHIDPARTRIADRGGFLYKWEIEVNENTRKATLVENKRKVIAVPKP